MNFDVQKLAIERYYDIIKMRAAQALALFIAFGFAIRASETFLDAASILALVIPLAAWFLDLVARRHYGAPLAYAALMEEISGLDEADEMQEDFIPNGLAFLIIDYKAKSSRFILELFRKGVSEKKRRAAFYKWYTFRDQLTPSLVFLFFFFVALFATGVVDWWNVQIPADEALQG